MSNELEQSTEFEELYDINKKLKKAAMLNSSNNKRQEQYDGIDILKMKANILPAQWYINYSDDVDGEKMEEREGDGCQQVTFDGLLSRMSRLEDELAVVEASCTYAEANNAEQSNDGSDERSIDRNNERSIERNNEQSSDRNNESSSDGNNEQSSDRNNERSSDRHDEGLSDQSDGRPSNRNDERFSDQSDGRPSNRRDERLSDQSDGRPSNRRELPETPVVVTRQVSETSDDMSLSCDYRRDIYARRRSFSDGGDKQDAVSRSFLNMLSSGFNVDPEYKKREEIVNIHGQSVVGRKSISVDVCSKEDKHHARRNGVNLPDVDLFQQHQKGKQRGRSRGLRGAQSLESLDKPDKPKFMDKLRHLKSSRNMESVEEEKGEDHEKAKKVGISMMEGSVRRVARTIDMYVDSKGELIRKVEIHKKENQCLGFYIRFGNGIDRDDGIFISRVTLGSLVDQNNLLLSGDEIIRVNGVDVVSTSLEYVVSMMQKVEILNIETRSTSALPFDDSPLPPKAQLISTVKKKKLDVSSSVNPYRYNHIGLSRTSSGPSKGLVPDDTTSKQRSRSGGNLVMENDQLITKEDLKAVKLAGSKSPIKQTATGNSNNYNDASSSSDSDELNQSSDNKTLTYPSDSSSINLSLHQSFTGKLAVDIASVSGISSTESNPCYCTIEINKEFKAKTQSHKSDMFVKFNDKFDIDIQQAKMLELKVFSENGIMANKCLSASCIVLEKLFGNESHKQLLLTATKGNIQIRLDIKFTEARSYLKRRQSTRATGVFGFNLSQTLVTERNTIPILVRKCVAEIEARGVQLEGIYRISGNARKKKELRKKFEENSNTTDISDQSVDCHVISGILKDYLRELPKPLISLEMYKKIHEKQQHENADRNAQRKMLTGIIKMAPYVNRATLIFIIDHLQRVSDNFERNKMNYKNLSVCFGPVMMCPPIEEMKDFQKYIDALEFLLTIWPSETKQNMI